MDVEPIDLGDELRERVQPRLDLAPVMFARPVAGELLHDRKLNALRCVWDLFALGPLRRVDALAEVGQVVVGSAEGKRADRGALVGFVRGASTGRDKTDRTGGGRCG